MADTSIEWTDRVWNPVRGCSRVSPGCDNCYAMRQAHRFSTPQIVNHKRTPNTGPRMAPYAGLTTIRKGKVDWTGTARFVPDQLAAPLSWRKPSRIFVNSMSDLFHHDVTNEQIAAVFGVMAACPQHTFQILTKRPERMVEWFKWAKEHGDGQDLLRGDMPSALLTCGWEANCGNAWGDVEIPERLAVEAFPTADVYGTAWPLPNVWLGVSAENQATADERIPLLLQIPAAVRFVSIEPLLEQVLFDDGETSWLTCDGRNRIVDDDYCCDAHAATGDHFHGIDWVIVGGESGHGARPCNVEWIRSIVKQCKQSGTACFVKQVGARARETRCDCVAKTASGFCPIHTEDLGGATDDRKGGDPVEWPADLRVREFPARAQ